MCKWRIVSHLVTKNNAEKVCAYKMKRCHLIFSILISFSGGISKYRNKIQGLDKDLKEILKQESEEKEVNKHACMQLSSQSGMQ